MQKLTDFTAGILAVMAAVILSVSNSFAGGEGWMTNFKEAQQMAKSEDKLILVDFTGSDWCGWCIKLRDEVFSKPEFDQYVKDKFVLVELDFPRKKQQPEDVKKQNEELAEKYQVKGFPTVLVLKPDGSKVEQLGYMPGGPQAFIDALKKAQEKA